MKYKDRKDAKRKYKQALLVTVTTMTLGVSTLGGSTSAFAEENTAPSQSSAQGNSVAPKGRVIQGYLFKDGIQTPVYTMGGKIQKSSSTEEDTAFPQLGSNPYDPIPKEGSVHSETGSIGSTLYFSSLPIPRGVINGVRTLSWDQNVYLEKNTDGFIEVGNYDPKTLIRTPKTETFDQETLKGFFEDTTVKRDTSYQLVPTTDTVQPRTSTWKFSKAVKSGFSKEDAINAGLTVGAKMGAKASGGVPGIASAEFSMEVSTQVSTSFNHKWVATTEETTTIERTLPAITNTTYKYDYYALALYQLHSTFTVKPGKKLQAFLDENKDNFTRIDAKGTKIPYAALAQTAFSYADSTTYLAVTPGAASQ
ncbi:hypothetical protein OF864_14375 [Bacillus cereus]|uniref:hypothetical protein n=1 Tax=Bacillus TaxID=1386 RepID=UPI0024BBBBA6|nr:hypothetical protein [Bacillus cereus]WHS78392.1 hypothetical protein OF864_14375 [Bacillus cereus]